MIDFQDLFRQSLPNYLFYLFSYLVFCLSSYPWFNILDPFSVFSFNSHQCLQVGYYEQINDRFICVAVCFSSWVEKLPHAMLIFRYPYVWSLLFCYLAFAWAVIPDNLWLLPFHNLYCYLCFHILWGWSCFIESQCLSLVSCSSP